MTLPDNNENEWSQSNEFQGQHWTMLLDEEEKAHLFDLIIQDELANVQEEMRIRRETRFRTREEQKEFDDGASRSTTIPLTTSRNSSDLENQISADTWSSDMSEPEPEHHTSRVTLNSLMGARARESLSSSDEDTWNEVRDLQNRTVTIAPRTVTVMNSDH